MTYNGTYIDAVYFSTSNGRTEDPVYVWKYAVSDVAGRKRCGIGKRNAEIVVSIFESSFGKKLKSKIGTVCV